MPGRWTLRTAIDHVWKPGGDLVKIPAWQRLQYTVKIHLQNPGDSDHGISETQSPFWLVVWNMAIFFHFIYGIYIWDVILPIDELIFFRGVGWNHQAAFIFVAETCFQDSIPFLPGFCTGHQLHRELQDLEFKEDGSGKAPKFDSWSCANFG